MLRPALAVVNQLAQLLWPARCACCDELVAATASFCQICDTTLLLVVDACTRCALPAGGRCLRCAGEPFPFSRAVAGFAYGGAITESILRLKHGGRIDLARALGRSFAPVLAQEVVGADAVLPVPLHPHRLRTRGFNQALELIRAARTAWGSRTSWPPLWVDTLRRTRDTPALGRLSPAQRREMVAGAFSVAALDQVRGRRLLVVDDVMTTGVTLAGCARALLDAGAVEVRVAALARAL